MISGTTIIAIMTVANFVLLLALLRILIRDNFKRNIPAMAAPVPSQNQLEEVIASILQQPAFAETKEEKPEPILASAPARSQTVSKSEQMQMAINRLKLGESPEQVAQELGYSRSEIGILAASSRQS
jgi:hypothetical protein